MYLGILFFWTGIPRLNVFCLFNLVDITSVILRKVELAIGFIDHLLLADAIKHLLGVVLAMFQRL